MTDKHFQFPKLTEYVSFRHVEFARRWAELIETRKIDWGQHLDEEDCKWWSKMDLWTLEEAVYLVGGQKPINRTIDMKFFREVVSGFTDVTEVPHIDAVLSYEIDNRDTDIGDTFEFVCRGVDVGALKAKGSDDNDYLTWKISPLDLIWWALNDIPVHEGLGSQLLDEIRSSSGEETASLAEKLRVEE